MRIKIVTIGVILNLLSSVFFVYAQSDMVTGSVEIGPCALDCLQLEVPTLISKSGTIFINNSGGQILLTNSILDKVKVTDLRSTANNWDLVLQATDLVNTSGEKIDFSEIGIMTFTGSTSETIQTGPYDSGVTAPLHKNYSFTDFLDGSSSQPVEGDFTFFPENSAAISPAIIIINSDNAARIGEYATNIGLYIKTPASPANTLRDGNYLMTLTFTLTS